jgi:hypothetical protein
MGQVCQCLRRACRKINVSPPGSDYHMFFGVYQFVIYLLTISCTLKLTCENPGGHLREGILKSALGLCEGRLINGPKSAKTGIYV